MHADTAVVVGVGPGLGEAVAKRFVDEGSAVGLIARSDGYVDDLEARLEDRGGDAVGISADVRDRDAVREAFDTIGDGLGSVDVLVYNANAAPWEGSRDIAMERVERAVDVGVNGLVRCAKEVVPDMLATDGGTVIVTGATTAIRGRGDAVGFSAAKFGARGVAGSLARELGPEGIHVAHVVIDGKIAERGTGDRTASEDRQDRLEPDAVADAYVDLVEQDRSAWTLELDLRPHVEEF